MDGDEGEQSDVELLARASVSLSAFDRLAFRL